MDSIEEQRLPIADQGPESPYFRRMSERFARKIEGINALRMNAYSTEESPKADALRRIRKITQEDIDRVLREKKKPQ